MQENVYDSVVSKMLDRIEKASDTIALRFKGVTPFNKERIPEKEIRAAFQTLSRQSMIKLIERHGVEAVNDFIAEMEEKNA